MKNILKWNWRLILKRVLFRFKHFYFFYKNRKKMEKMFKGKTVALIGNAESIFESYYGELIDKHDFVIRLNMGKVIDSKSQGTRTDVIGYSVKGISLEELNKYFQTDSSFFIWCLPKVELLDEKFVNYQVILYPIRRWLVARFKIGSKLTTGFMAFDLLNNLLNKGVVTKLSVFGFDFFRTDNFIDPGSHLKHKHDFLREEFIMKKEIEGNENLFFYPNKNESFS